MKLSTPFGSHIFRGLRLHLWLGVREEGEEVKPRSRRGYCKFMQSASHTLTLLECTNGSRIVHSSSASVLHPSSDRQPVQRVPGPHNAIATRNERRAR